MMSVQASELAGLSLSHKAAVYLSNGIRLCALYREFSEHTKQSIVHHFTNENKAFRTGMKLSVDV